MPRLPGTRLLTAPFDPAAAAVSQPVRPRSSLVKGILYGIVASTIGGAFLAFSRAGLTQSGLGAPEVALFRAGIAGAVFLPWLILNWQRCQAHLTLYDVMLYVVLIGPPFVLIGVSGYLYAPLVHGAVFLPGSLLVFGTVIPALFLKEPVDRVKKISVLVICIGFLVIAAPGFMAGGPAVLAGDALFLWAGAQWSAFAILVSHRRTDPVIAVASLSVLAMVVYCPLYFTMFGTATLAAAPLSALVINALVQGLLAGAIAVLSYSLCISHLGATRAALFPAMVPVLTLVIGIPLTGEWLIVSEWIAVVIIVGGLLTSVRIWDRVADIPAVRIWLTKRKATR